MQNAGFYPDKHDFNWASRNRMANNLSVCLSMMVLQSGKTSNLKS